jgi:hypothetical protein
VPAVRYLVDFPNDDRPTELPGDTRAVMASAYAWCDIGQGGVTAEEIDLADVAAIITYPVGSELFIESADPTDCLDDADATTVAATKIWWRAVVEPP